MKQLSFSGENSGHSKSSTICINNENVDFLGTGNPSPNTVTSMISIQSENTSNELYIDLESLTATELRKKYVLSYSSWKNMKSRCKDFGYILDPRFNKFSTFLGHMGARPSKEFSIDRVDCENPNYGPDHCRWADKHTQNQNKGNNVMLTHKGETHTVSVWANKTEQKADTLYHRKSKGWSDDEVITGIRNTAPAPAAEIVRVASLTPEKLEEYLSVQIIALQAAQEKLLSFYDENGPEFSAPMEAVSELEVAQNNYYLLLAELKRRVPSYDVRVRFHYLMQSD